MAHAALYDPMPPLRQIRVLAWKQTVDDRPLYIDVALMWIEHADHQYTLANVYRHPKVMAVMTGAESIVGDLFQRYLAAPETLPGAARARHAAGLDRPARAVETADFVAGMTDRFAIEEHRRLFTSTPELRA